MVNKALDDLKSDAYVAGQEASIAKPGRSGESLEALAIEYAQSLGNLSDIEFGYRCAKESFKEGYKGL